MSRAGDGGRPFRVAAVGDLHYDGSDPNLLAQLAAEVEREGDMLLLCGDLTTHGQPSQFRAVAQALASVRVPIVTVLGNHDHETGSATEGRAILEEQGIHVLDGESIEIEGVGFAGAKGFAGGYGRAALGAFGEPIIKAFVQEAIEESLKLENALRELKTETKVAVLHYSPVADTLVGEPEQIFCYLGSDRLLPPVESQKADVVFHGHAHTGCLEGRTPGGIPVYNVSLPLLRKHGRLMHVWTTGAPERRGRPEDAQP